MEWRYVPFRRYDPYFKTGLNQAVLESVPGKENPTIFLAGWDRKCVNVGRSQTIEEEVDLEKAREDNVEVVRRQGGGGTTFLTPEGEITWGIVAGKEYFPEDVNRTYKSVCGKVAEALGKIGIDAEHQPINDVVTGGRKISGATMKEKDSTVYVGGTLLYTVDPEEMFTYLTPDEDKLKGKQIQDFRDRVTSVRQESEANFSETREALKRTLLEEKNFQKSDWTEREISRARELADKYSGENWLHRQ